MNEIEPHPSLESAFVFPIPQDLKLIYIFNHSWDQMYLMKRGIELQKQGYSIGVSGIPGGNGCLGYTERSKFFREKGATPPFPIPQDGSDEKDAWSVEAENLVLFAARTGLEKIGVMTAPPYWTDAIVFTVKLLLKRREEILREHGLEIKVYPVPAVRYPPTRTFQITRWNESFPSLAQLLEYFEWRDNGIARS